MDASQPQKPYNSPVVLKLKRTGFFQSVNTLYPSRNTVQIATSFRKQLSNLATEVGKLKIIFLQHSKVFHDSTRKSTEGLKSY